MEQLPEIREQLLKINAKKWAAIAEYQKTRVFCPDDATIQAQAARLAQTYDLNVLESMMPDDPKCAKCGEPAAMYRGVLLRVGVCLLFGDSFTVML